MRRSTSAAKRFALLTASSLFVLAGLPGCGGDSGATDGAEPEASPNGTVAHGGLDASSCVTDGDDVEAWTLPEFYEADSSATEDEEGTTVVTAPSFDDMAVLMDGMERSATRPVPTAPPTGARLLSSDGGPQLRGSAKDALVDKCAWYTFEVRVHASSIYAPESFCSDDVTLSRGRNVSTWRAIEDGADLGSLPRPGKCRELKLDDSFSGTVTMSMDPGDAEDPLVVGVADALFH